MDSQSPPNGLLMDIVDAILGFLMLMFCISLVVLLYAAVKEARKTDRFDIW